ncbi:MAG: thioesterase [Deltaproteobacteria bacterium]|nr:thioesterase [Deltaproteobacteria bacterium]
MNTVNTHQKIDQGLCGTPLEVRDGYSRVELTTTGGMTVDDSSLVHGGFVFGLADYAAMIAVNHPNVVLGAADVKFLKPVVAGETMIAEARVASASGKKHRVEVRVTRGDTLVFSGKFACFVLEKHVLG